MQKPDERSVESSRLPERLEILLDGRFRQLYVRSKAASVWWSESFQQILGAHNYALRLFALMYTRHIERNVIRDQVDARISMSENLRGFSAIASFYLAREWRESGEKVEAWSVT